MCIVRDLRRIQKEVMNVMAPNSNTRVLEGMNQLFLQPITNLVVCDLVVHPSQMRQKRFPLSIPKHRSIDCPISAIGIGFDLPPLTMVFVSVK